MPSSRPIRRRRTVTVNFGDKPYAMPDGTEIAPMGNRWEGVENK